jgi:murein L,D-transpeptidase YafK
MRKLLSLVLLSLLVTSCNPGILKVPKVIYESRIKADSIIVDKSDKKLYLLKSGKKLREYTAHMGTTPGKKMYEDDKRTPEGNYFISSKNPSSQYFLSLGISYPSREDALNAREAGKKPGGAIMIHGMPNKASLFERIKNQYVNWTAGCIAVTDKEIVEIYAMVDVGTPILIRP